jgi:phosphoribosylanthranilate isomerase
MNVQSILSRKRFPRIKVCGVTRAVELQFLSAAGVDTVGINLVPSSQRCVNLELARELVGAAGALDMLTVAVMMNPSLDFLNEALRAAPWDFIQLHGQEEPELSSHCAGVPIIKATACSGLEHEMDRAARWIAQSPWSHAVKNADISNTPSSKVSLACILVDAFAPIEGGGTGRTARWDLLLPRPSQIGLAPLVLAGQPATPATNPWLAVKRWR